MERYTISKSEKQTIYEIYRACRICGAGGGYRMPIVQNIVDLDTSDVELRQKIQDCLQLEVRPDDRMPPLICELCVDKVNDFYVFLELSRQTNIRTRTRLGLPLQTAKKGEPEPADCILGVTEPLCADKPAPKKSMAGPKCSKKVNKETESVNVKLEAASPSPAESRSSSCSSRSGRAGRRPPEPLNEPPKTALKQYHNKAAQDKKRVKEKDKEPEKEKQAKETPSTKFSMLNKELQDLIQDSQKYDNNSLLVPRSMKRRDVEPPRPAVVPKRTRTAQKEPIIESVNEPTPPRRRPGPKSRQVPPREDPKSRQVALREDSKSRQVAPREDPKSRQVAPREDPKPKPPPKEDPKIPVPLKIPRSRSKLNVTPPQVEAPPAKVTPKCPICDMPLKTNSALSNHLKSHLPTFTKPQVACDPCGKWFLSAELAAAHHRHHRASTFPYHCRRCFNDYRTLLDYDAHIANGLCMPYDVIPDVECGKCWKPFITRTLLDSHKCQGYDGRPGGNCPKCSRSYTTQKTLKAHLKVCAYRKKNTGDLKADPDVLRRLKPMQVRIARCDDLLARPAGGRYPVAAVRPNHGLDKNYVYPYFRLKTVKPESRLKVPTHGPIRDEPERDAYTHWDSEDSDSDSVIKKVNSLTVLCLKKIFSKNLLGKVPRKRRRVSNDVFDSINDFSASSDINDIINSLNDDLGSCVSKTRKDSLISIAINDIIGVPNTFVPNLGNENVDRSSNDVNIIINNENDKHDLNDVEIEHHGTDTVVSASDISTELNLIETEDHDNTRNGDAIESTGDDVETNDSVTRNDLNDKNENDLNNDLGIRNFKSVDDQNDSDNLKDSNATNVQNNLSTEDDYGNAELNRSENNDVNFDSQNKSDNGEANDCLPNQNANTGNGSPNNDSEMSIDNLDIENNCANIKESNDLETRNVNNEHKNPDYDSVMHNDNLEGTENNYDNPAINDLKIENENDDQHVNVESDLQNDNLIINPSGTKNYGDDGMNNDFETQNLNSETNLGNTQNDNINKNYLDTENNENTELDRIGDETENFENSQDVEEPNLQNAMEELQNSHLNSVHEYNNKTNSNFDESEKLEEVKNTNKESPIKHSIVNLIGDTDKNPDKYIDEVISSIEDIINKNPRKEEINDNTTNGENSNEIDDQVLMDAIDNEINDGKDKMDSEKITLDDLLPKNNTSMELDDISDEDFNFDA